MSNPKQKTAIGAMAIPINSKGEYLITLRNEPNDPQTHKKWQVTGGGIEFGESPEQTLQRELKEEIGIDHFTYLAPHPMVKTWVWRYPDREFHIILLCYLIDIGDQKIKIDNQENIDYRWIQPSQIKDLDYLPLTDDFIFEAEKILKNKW